MELENYCHREIKLQNDFVERENNIRIWDLGTSRTLELLDKYHHQEFNNKNQCHDKMLTLIGMESYMTREI